MAERHTRGGESGGGMLCSDSRVGRVKCQHAPHTKHSKKSTYKREGETHTHTHTYRQRVGVR